RDIDIYGGAKEKQAVQKQIREFRSLKFVHGPDCVREQENSNKKPERMFFLQPVIFFLHHKVSCDFHFTPTN
ncbi:hypothetical protein VIGAN_03182300, partial [Vigna angularis var. angularis]